MADDERIVRIEEKLDKVVEHISSIEVTMASQHVSLKDHIRRTEILEGAVQPMVKHEHMILGVIKACAALMAVGGFLFAAIEAVSALGAYLK